MGSRSGSRQGVSPLLGNFGSPSGAQKSTKNRFLAEKASPEATFLSFFLFFLLLFAFLIDFVINFHQKSMFFRSFFSIPSRLFFNMATLTIVCILHIQMHFFIFPNFQKIGKNLPKFNGKYFQKKTPKMTPEGTQNRPKLMKHRRGEAPKSPKWPKKVVF